MRRARRGGCDLYAPAAVLVAALAAGCGSVVEEPVKEPPRPVAVRKERSEQTKPKEETLCDAINHALALLTERRFVTFLSRFMSPADKANLLKGTTLLEFAKEYAANEKAVIDMIDVLKASKAGTPVLSRDGAKATFHLDYPGSRPGEKHTKSTFRRIDGTWYVGEYTSVHYERQ